MKRKKGKRGELDKEWKIQKEKDRDWKWQLKEKKKKEKDLMKLRGRKDKKKKQRIIDLTFHLIQSSKTIKQSK